MQVVALGHAAEALEQLGGALREAGAEGELSYGILARLVDEPEAWGAQVTMLVGMRGPEPVALVTMTGRHPALIVGFGRAGRVDFGALAAAMMAEGRLPDSVNGAVRWSEPFAQAWIAAGVAAVETRREMRAFELRAVRRTPLAAGAFREAAAADAGQLVPWAAAMSAEIGEPIDEQESVRVVERLIANRDLCLWEHGGQPVSMAAITRRTPWSSCVALVYTPPGLRGQGFASAVVSRLSQRELDAGRRWCSLFTDLANPTSNHIYSEIGYEPRCDFRHINLIRRAA